MHRGWIYEKNRKISRNFFKISTIFGQILAIFGEILADFENLSKSITRKILVGGIYGWFPLIRLIELIILTWIVEKTNFFHKFFPKLRTTAL